MTLKWYDPFYKLPPQGRCVLLFVDANYFGTTDVILLPRTAVREGDKFYCACPNCDEPIEMDAVCCWALIGKAPPQSKVIINKKSK